MSQAQKFIDLCDRAMAFSFYALIYFLPISIALTETFSGLAIFCYLLKRGTMLFDAGRRRSLSKSSLGTLLKPVPNYLNKPLAVFLAIGFLTVITSQFPRASIEGFVGKMLECAFMYFAFLECIRTKKRIKIFLVIFSVSILLICVSGLYQYFIGHDFIRGHIFEGRISSSFRQANDFAAYLVVTTPVLLYLSLFPLPKQKKDGDCPDGLSFLSTGKARGILFFLFMLSFSCLILTYSRGAWIAFILSLSVLAVQKRRIFLFSAVFLVIFLAAFYCQSARVRPLDSIMGNNLTRYFEWENNRLGYWTRSISIIRDYPVLGSGLNTYSSIQWQYDGVGWGGYPHNSYLQMTAETGVVGLLAFLWLIIILLINSFKNLQSMMDPFLRSLVLSFLAGLTGFLIHSFFDTNFYSVQLGTFMWVIIGVIVAAQKIGNSSEDSEVQKMTVS